MDSFLTLVARDLLRRNIDLAQATLVFPGKRAVTFFNEALFAEAGEKPLWAPRYTTISELFQTLSQLTLADPIDCVCRVHEQYVKATCDKVSLDVFYGWGERLLKDFDDIDKNLSLTQTAEQIFDNLKDLNELTSLDFLTDEQRQILSRFFHDFEHVQDSEIQQRFMKLWSALKKIYQGLRTSLLNDDMAYDGMLMREVMKQKKLPEIKGTYVFVGHNVLSRMEKELLRKIQKETETLFYWDYDESYMKNELEAGRFLCENLKEFPNALQEADFNNILKNTIDVEFVSATSDTQQARSVADWAREHLDTDHPKKTAIVLADEKLLIPVLHNLPENVENVNVTNGYPLQYSYVFTVVEDILKNVKDGTKNDEILTMLQENLKTLKTDENVLTQEAVFLVITICNRLRNLLESTSLNTLPTESFKKLLRMVLSQSAIPFSGEPLMGLQIMGMLETRCLDFDNVLILSCGEKILPAPVTHNSFIPFNIRKAFGLTMPIHRTALSAYYFYRLFQRAKHVRCVYNCSTNKNGTGEMSRFMTQMLVEMQGLNVKHLSLTTPSNVVETIPEAKKTPENIAEIITKLSPSAINTYIECPLKFYYQKIEKIQETVEETGVLQGNDFGTIFHSAAEQAYKKMAEGDGVITEKKLQDMQKNEALLDTFVEKAYKDFLKSSKCKDKTLEFNIIIAGAIKKYLKLTLEYDKNYAPLRDLKVEEEPKRRFTGENFDIELHGYIDRMDVAKDENGNDFLHIVDYKSGGFNSDKMGADKLETVFSNFDKRYMLQTFFYSYLLKDSTLPVRPQLYFLQKLDETGIKISKKLITDFREYMDEFETLLRKVISEIFDVEKDFSGPKKNTKCENCPYQLLCFGKKS